MRNYTWYDFFQELVCNVWLVAFGLAVRRMVGTILGNVYEKVF